MVRRLYALYTDGRGSRDNLGTNGYQWPWRTADRRTILIPGNSHPLRTRNLSSPPPIPLEICSVHPALAKLPHSPSHSIG